MAKSVQNMSYAKKYNVNNYTYKYTSQEMNNSFNKVQLNNNYFKTAKILNVKHITEIAEIIDDVVGAYKENISKLREIRNNIAQNPPIKNKGNNVALKKMDELMAKLDKLDSDLNLIPNSAVIISDAYVERNKNIDSTIKELETRIEYEKTDKEVNEDAASKGFLDYLTGNV